MTASLSPPITILDVRLRLMPLDSLPAGRVVSRGADTVRPSGACAAPGADRGGGLTVAGTSSETSSRGASGLGGTDANRAPARARGGARAALGSASCGPGIRPAWARAARTRPG